MSSPRPKRDPLEIVAVARMIFGEAWREGARASLHVDDDRLDRLIDGREEVSEATWEDVDLMLSTLPNAEAIRQRTKGRAN